MAVLTAEYFCREATYRVMATTEERIALSSTGVFR